MMGVCGSVAYRRDDVDSVERGPVTTQVTPTLDDLVEVADVIRSAMESVIEGKRDVVDTVLTVLFGGGHLLVEDVPGVGKTLLAKALARSVDCSVRRIQFTPDLMPTDITGVSIYNQETRAFEFKPGAVFANVVVGDEINRASPKTQSALLECMEERQVTVDGVSYPLPPPFIVIATQNPIEMHGTYPLPEAQRDRFMARVSMGYPSGRAELAMLDSREDRDPLDTLGPVADADAVRRICAAVLTVHAGASPRATLHLLRAAQAHAALAGRGYVTDDDVQRLAPTVLTHRLLPTSDTQLARRPVAEVLTEVLAAVPTPGRR
jgi:MoxR-like ATPase